MPMNSKLQMIALRIASLGFGLFSLWLIARWWARYRMFWSGHHPAWVLSWLGIVASGMLSIWLAKLAGPWSKETAEPPRS